MLLFTALEMFARGDDGLMDGWMVGENHDFRPSLLSPWIRSFDRGKDSKFSIFES